MGLLRYIERVMFVLFLQVFQITPDDSLGLEETRGIRSLARSAQLMDIGSLCLRHINNMLTFKGLRQPKHLLMLKNWVYL